ncbi:hypothetical protein [Tumebacillus lipolyticus]|uniref:Uncharacterized protein n=1 Tax=Tumebacillus lipolyticus TaxID=1280370 RepID=A0ABW5A2V8_9BACL
MSSRKKIQKEQPSKNDLVGKLTQLLLVIKIALVVAQEIGIHVDVVIQVV